MEDKMKKTLALTLCLMLLPVMASAYTFCKGGVVRETIFNIQILSPGALVTLIDETNGGASPSVLTGTDGQYLVSKTVPFPAGKIVIKQCWHVTVVAGLTNMTATSPASSCWSFGRAHPFEVKCCRENFNLVYDFNNCEGQPCGNRQP
jgi:hypothetical protein